MSIKVKDRFEEVGDRRNAGRVVEVTRVIGLTDSARRHIEKRRKGANPNEEALEDLRSRRTYFYVKTEAHPKNPDAIGNVSRLSEKTLLHSGRYKKVSR